MRHEAVREIHAEGRAPTGREMVRGAILDATQQLVDFGRVMTEAMGLLPEPRLFGPLVVVLRVENREGEGPYSREKVESGILQRRRISRRGVDAERRDPNPHPECPGSEHEKLPFCMKRDFFCFVSLWQLVRWFDRRTRRELEAAGGTFKVVAYIAEARGVRASESQAVFDRRRARRVGETALDTRPRALRELYIRARREALSSAVPEPMQTQLEEIPL